MNTRIFFRKSRIIRLPFDLRNAGQIDLGRGLTTGKYCRIEACLTDDKEIVLQYGDNVQIKDFVHIAAHSSILETMY